LGRRYQASDLAQQTFNSLAPWVNLQCGGKWHVPYDGEPHPIYLIKQEASELWKRWKKGERFLYYQNGGRFFPSHLWSYLRAKHIEEMIAGQCKYYYTGGQHGRTLLMIDVDAHDPSQTDAKETLDQVVELLGPDKCFVVESTRGYNVFVKWQYLELRPFMVFRRETWQEANKPILELQAALKRVTAHRLSGVEVKGTISIFSQHYGSLAKLPCYEAWSEARLSEFQNLPVVDTPWVLNKIEMLNQGVAEPARTKTVKTMKTGSCDSFTLSQKEIDSIPGFVKSLKSRSWYCHSRKIDPKRQDVKLVPLDFSYAFVVLSLARKHRKQKFGEQMPTNFIQAIWNHLYEKGIFTRAFDCSRWAAIRNTLADCGFLLFVNNLYWFDRRGEKRGKAMEWRLLDEYDVFYTQEEREEVIIQEVYPIYQPIRWRPLFVNLENCHFRLIERLERWESDDYGGLCCEVAA